VWVAAAGNNTRAVSLPAALDPVIAVGAYDARRGEVAPYARYDEVPPERFLLAPGGANDAEGSFGTLPNPPDQFLHGTSFAAPMVSGLVARLLSDSTPPVTRLHRTLPWILESLRATANRDFPGYDPRKHGLGRARASAGGPGVGDAASSHIYAPGNVTLPAHLRQQVEERAYHLWTADGRPGGRDLEFWMRAKATVGVPSWFS
jgi:subtilisin family serine protease